MFYKPKFCNECGERIEKETFGFFSIRRFCENCADDFGKHEWLPKAAVIGVVILSSLFAVGSYLKTPEKRLEITRNQTSIPLIGKINANQNNNHNTNAFVKNNEIPLQANIQKNANNPLQKSSEIKSTQKEDEKPVYFCGAQTKKGTACTRRVKTENARCWQHKGEIAIPQKQK